MLGFLGAITNTAYAYLSAGIGAGLVTIGAGMGIGRIAANAMDGIARQPEAAAKIQTAMIIGAAFIEALTIYVFIVFILANGKIGV